MFRAVVATWLSFAPPNTPESSTPSTLTLQWDAPTTCPAADDIDRAFVRYVGDESAVAIDARATVTETGVGYHLDLWVAGQHKALDSEACAELAEAAAVILSIAATEPETAAPNVEEETPAAPSPEPPIETPLAKPPPPVEPPPVPAPAPDPLAELHPPGVRASLRAEAGFRFGVMPVFGGDASLAVGLLWPAARVELAGTFWTPREATLDAAQNVVVLATLGSVEARGCWTPYIRRLEFPLCAGFELGATRVDARGSAPAGVQHGLWAGASIGASVVWLLHRNFGLWLGPEAVLALRRPTFDVADSSYRPGPAAIRGMLGFEARFP